MYVVSEPDDIYGNIWAEGKENCLEVELHRVQGIADVLPNPWRALTWTEKHNEELRQNLVSFKPTCEVLSKVRILLLGPVGAGKSSFVNSIKSVMYRYVSLMSCVGTTPEGFTKKLKSYEIWAEKGGLPTALTLCDVLALGESKETGLTLHDILQVIKGHVPEGHKFQRKAPIYPSAAGYQLAPALKDRIHCVAFVLDASKVLFYNKCLEDQLKEIRWEISDMDIPHVILLTNVDKVCKAVEADVQYVYRSHILKERIHKAAELMGLPVSFVLPVKNYSSEHSVNCNTDILLLSALNCMLGTIDDGRFPSLVPLEPNQESSLSELPAMSNTMQLLTYQNRMYVVSEPDDIYGNIWAEGKENCLEVELHRVQDIADIGLLPNPWRALTWTEKHNEELRQNLVSFKPTCEVLSKVRILLLGPVGAGKSSFVNSIKSVMYRYVSLMSCVGTTPEGFTKKLKSYEIWAEKGGLPTALTLCDVLALGESKETGLTLHDTLQVIKGHVPEGHKFQRKAPIYSSTAGYQLAPALKDRIHCVAFVLDASKVLFYNKCLEDQLKEIRWEISDMDIPHVILLTNVDKVCKAVEADVQYVYRSHILKERIHKAAELMGLPVSFVLPVKNYSSVSLLWFHWSPIKRAAFQSSPAMSNTMQVVGKE
ncbi:hypothetical protein SKAU_G00028890 [Synaphobranchus kaupii]|uniref:Interferon-induced protein 44 n=1 Tax=Synaphobranchus kaupii TaxID=118154 RepID=A0A9Q1GD79_SYNKA|nr:hypothetical protein SKAU_G00028890 [Synaphobranchus kaupii]